MRKFIGCLQRTGTLPQTAYVLSLIHILRSELLHNLEYLGVQVDEEKNLVHGVEREITTPDSTVRGFVIPTNEELVIARDTKALVEQM